MKHSSTSLLPIIEARVNPGSTRWEDSRDWHLFDTDSGTSLYVADGSRVFALDHTTARAFRTTTDDDDALNDLLVESGIPRLDAITDEPIETPPLRSLSLAVAQKCNLGCTYCYAQEGSFGAPAVEMPVSVARAAVDKLLDNAVPGDRFHISFLGGEPLLARQTIRDTTRYAQEAAQRRHCQIGFSITSNGTLITHDDGEFFEEHGFAVTISIDGVGEVHNALRPFKGGQGSYSRIIQNVLPLLKMQHHMQVSARVTVTPKNLDLVVTLNELLELGFHSVGFSPMLASPAGREQMGHDELDQMLEQMISCGRECERRIIGGERFSFSNLITAMNEIHRGTHRPYPCGAGAGYLGVSADGELSACHRFVGDAAGFLGSVADGIDTEKQSRWLMDRHVHRQEPCTSCWARYLCGGGCHHEVLKRGRPACDYIRGWLHYCMQAYVRVLAKCPGYFHGN